jgi:hypothetical protein
VRWNIDDLSVDALTSTMGVPVSFPVSRSRASHEATFELVMAVAEGSIDLPEIAERLRQVSE